MEHFIAFAILGVIWAMCLLSSGTGDNVGATKDWRVE